MGGCSAWGGGWPWPWSSTATRPAQPPALLLLPHAHLPHSCLPESKVSLQVCRKPLRTEGYSVKSESQSVFGFPFGSTQKKRFLSGEVSMNTRNLSRSESHLKAFCGRAVSGRGILNCRNLCVFDEMRRMEVQQHLKHPLLHRLFPLTAPNVPPPPPPAAGANGGREGDEEEGEVFLPVTANRGTTPPAIAVRHKRTCSESNKHGNT